MVSKLTHQSPAYLGTGQQYCYDAEGSLIKCRNTGQDAEYHLGIIANQDRFIIENELVRDTLTDLVWTREASLTTYPMMWQEALDYIHELNSTSCFGYHDWRLPNRHELCSLLNFQHSRPALPVMHPFKNVFHGWYWTSTSAAISPSHAWHVHMEGARVFFGGKDQSYMVWPVRGASNAVLSFTGQRHCYDSSGNIIRCRSSGQDGEYLYGRPWPVPRFYTEQNSVHDNLTNLVWTKKADLTNHPVSWVEALEAIKILNAASPDQRWRLPNINELETLIDCDQSQPALPISAPFENLQDVYWSSTTSVYEPDWAWALYLNKGAIGVGQKSGRTFYVWPVRN